MKKNIIAIFAAVLVVVLLIFGLDIQSVDEYYLTHIDDITPESETVFLTIDCSAILDNYENLDENLRFDKYVPKDGKILPKTEYVLRSGDTAFDVLSRAVRYNKIQMEYQGADKNSYSTVYIKGINYLYEYSCGPLSGWMYTVNGESVNKGCSDYVLKDKDCVEFVYSCNIGKDLE